MHQTGLEQGVYGQDRKNWANKKGGPLLARLIV
jgi:hypothetical protein